MKACIVLLLLAGMGPRLWSASADPTEAFQQAIGQLMAAGNYTWEAKDTVDIDAKGPVGPRGPTLTAETEIDGFTLATSFRRTMVRWNRQFALKTKAGWRHADDLTAEEIQELRVIVRKSGSSTLVHTHALPHEILRLLEQMGTNIRKEQGVIVGDIDASLMSPLELGSYIRFGRLPERPALATRFGQRPRSSGPGNASATFAMHVTNGQIEEFTVTIGLTANVALNGGPREPHTSENTHIIKLLNIGTTRVTIEPEARALFLDAPAAR